MVTSWRTTSATRRSRTVFAAVSTAARAAASHESLDTPMTSVTRYTLSAIGSFLPGSDAEPGRIRPMRLRSRRRQGERQRLRVGARAQRFAGQDRLLEA